jgi:Ras-related protein Rab-8A
VNKILVGNKSDWTDKRAITEEEGRELAEELGIKFIETSAKINEGVEEAFFTLARCVKSYFLDHFSLMYRCGSVLSSDIKARLIDSQADAANAPSSAAPDSIKVNQPAAVQAPSCCT